MKSCPHLSQFRLCNKMPQTGVLNNRHLLLPVVQAGKFGIRMSGLVSAKGLLPGLQTATFLLCSHGLSLVYAPREGTECSLFLFYKDSNLITVSILMISSKPISFPEAALRIPSHWGIGINVGILGEILFSSEHSMSQLPTDGNL
jgi:hypothetical protein